MSSWFEDYNVLVIIKSDYNVFDFDDYLEDVDNDGTLMNFWSLLGLVL